VSGATPALIAAAAGVGFAHAIMPDHWLPLAVVGRTKGYPLARVARLSGLAGVAHVLASLALGALVVIVGLQLRTAFESAQNTIVGAVLLASGLGLIALELRGHPHGHRHAHIHGMAAHDHGDHHGRSDGHAHGRQRIDTDDSAGRSLAAMIVPFGAAASPDLTILPVFVAATAAGAGTAIGSLIAFALATIATVVTLTVLATFGGYRLTGRWVERWTTAITAVVLIVIGTLVLTSTI
jgi:hypothetical protein